MSVSPVLSPPSGGVIMPISSSSSAKPKKQPFWLGGAASMGAACCTHPLDLLKVRLQLQCTTASVKACGALDASVAPAPRQGLVPLVAGIIRNEGFFSLYAGLSASLLRQATYSTVRFGCYEGLKMHRLEELRLSGSKKTNLSMFETIGYSLASGALGGVAGNPADLVNVRMQNDAKLPIDQRRNYSHVGEALLRVARTEGVPALWNGVGPNIIRAMLMTSGQLASYDFFKHILVDNAGFDGKNVTCHLTASCLAGVVATILTQPVDVVKTRVMNAARSSAKAGSTSVAPSNPLQLAQMMLRTEGAGSFFKGFVPALTRLGPHTIATFVFLEQLKKLI